MKRLITFFAVITAACSLHAQTIVYSIADDFNVLSPSGVGVPVPYPAMTVSGGTTTVKPFYGARSYYVQWTPINQTYCNVTLTWTATPKDLSSYKTAVMYVRSEDLSGAYDIFDFVISEREGGSSGDEWAAQFQTVLGSTDWIQIVLDITTNGPLFDPKWDAASTNINKYVTRTNVYDLEFVAERPPVLPVTSTWCLDHVLLLQMTPDELATIEPVSPQSGEVLSAPNSQVTVDIGTGCSNVWVQINGLMLTNSDPRLSWSSSSSQLIINTSFLSNITDGDVKVIVDAERGGAINPGAKSGIPAKQLAYSYYIRSGISPAEGEDETIIFADDNADGFEPSAGALALDFATSGDFESVTASVLDRRGGIVAQNGFHVYISGPQVVWDGKDDNGDAVPGGIYFIRVVAQGGSGNTTRAVKTIPISVISR